MSKKALGECTLFKYKTMATPVVLTAIALVLIISGLSLAEPPNPGDNHLITGTVYYDGSTPADGAVVNLTNLRTHEQLSDVVGPAGNSNTSGYYYFDLANLSQGFADGDTLIVNATGTGTYSKYWGTNSTDVNTAFATQKIHLSLTLDDTPPAIQDETPETATTGDSFTFTATITDANPIYNVNVTYWYGDSTEKTTIPLTTTAGHYTATITIPDTLDPLHYTITASDILNNQNTTPTTEVSIEDNDAPLLQITGGPTGTTTATTATFTWQATDNIGPLEYRYKLTADYSQWTSGTTKSYANLGLGSYTFTVQARDSAGNTDTATRSFTVEQEGPVNEKPDAGFTYTPTDPTTQTDIQFNDTSTDDGDIVNWTWDFGDATYSYIQSPTHRYQDAGTYTVKLTITDDGGKTDSATATIDVAEAPNQPPTAIFRYEPETPEVDETITFTDISDDTDGDIVNWTWQFGDGTISYEQNPQHAYNTSDTFTVRLTVTDDDGATDNSTQTIDVKEKEEAANWMLPVLAIIILVIIAIVVVYIWRQRSQQP